MINIGILASYNGTGFDALYEACQNKIIDAKVVVVISNNQDAKVLRNAQERDIENFVVNSQTCQNDNIDAQILKLLKKYNCDYVFLSGYMKKIDQQVLNNFHNKIINTHPSLLPKFGGVGMYGKYVHEAVIRSGEKVSGVTIHFVNEDYDDGEIIYQQEVLLSNNETPQTLEEKIKITEKNAIVEAFKKIINYKKNK